MKRCRVWSLSVLVALASMVAAPATAQEWVGKARVKGEVQDEEGEPLEGARVTLRLEGTDSGPEPLVTDERGRWALLGLRGGTWELLVEADGYVPAEGRLEVSEYQRTEPAVIALRPLPPQQQGPSAEEVRGWLERGNQLLEQARPAEARAEYERALAELPQEQHPLVLRGIARTHYEEEQPEQALKAVERALAVAPDDLDSLRLAINLLLELGREEEAESYTARLPESESMDATALLNLGIEAYNADDFEAALGYFDRAVHAAPERPEPHYYRGLVYMAQGEREAARTDFERLLEIAPEHEHAAEARQYVEYLQGES